MNTPSWQIWLDAVREGDTAAIDDFLGLGPGPLLRLAERNIQKNLRRRVDPEDVVQSAFRTVLRRMQGGQFLLEDDEKLWKLLCAVTLNKSRRQARRHLQQKRGLDRETYIDQADTQVADLECTQPTPTDAAILVDLIEHLVSSTSDVKEVGASWLKALAFTPDGRRLISGSEQTVTYWDVATGREIASLSVDRCVHRLSFIADGRWLALSGEDPRSACGGRTRKQRPRGSWSASVSTPCPGPGLHRTSRNSHHPAGPLFPDGNGRGGCASKLHFIRRLR